MTRDEIISMSREAGVSIRGHYDETGSTPQELQRFYERAVATEREACAILLENYAVQYDAPVWAFKISEAIRARGDK